MVQPALAPTHHLSSSVTAGRYDHHVLAAGAARTGQRPFGWLDGAKMRAGAVAAKYRGTRRDCRFQIAATACRRAKRWTAGDRPFRIDLSGQAAERAARNMRNPQAARVGAADGLYRILHPGSR